MSTSTGTRIERGEISPTVTMLERLLDASGNELVVTVRPQPDRPTPRRRMAHVLDEAVPL